MFFAVNFTCYTHRIYRQKQYTEIQCNDFRRKLDLPPHTSHMENSWGFYIRSCLPQPEQVFIFNPSIGTHLHYLYAGAYVKAAGIKCVVLSIGKVLLRIAECFSFCGMANDQSNESPS